MPSVEVRAGVKKTVRQKRAALAKDTADVLNVLGRADLDAWYPETFTVSYGGGDDR